MIQIEREAARNLLDTLTAVQQLLRTYADQESVLVQSVQDEVLALRRLVARKYNAK